MYAFLINLFNNLLAGQSIKKAVDEAWTKELGTQTAYRLFLAKPNGDIWLTTMPTANKQEKPKDSQLPDSADSLPFSPYVQVDNSTIGNVIQSSSSITINQQLSSPGSMSEPSPIRRSNVPEHYLIQLFEIVRGYFNEEEIRTMCFYLRVDYGALPAQGTAGKARELIYNLDSNDRIPELVAYIKQQRPNLNLEFPTE